MIINSSKVKTEALLLLCRDIIESYNTNENIFNVPCETIEFINQKMNDLLKALNTVLQPNDYYIRNYKVSRIHIILKTHKYLQNTLSKYFKNGDKFDPAMLCFALLSTWFAELNHGDFKEFLYFKIYPYSEVYDKLLLNIDNTQFRELNIAMLNIAEHTVIKLNNYKFK